VSYFQRNGAAQSKSKGERLVRKDPGAEASKKELVDKFWGKAETEMDVSAEDVLAYIWNFMSYGRCAEHRSSNGNALRVALDVPESHSKLMVVGKKMMYGVDDRVTAAWWVWRREPDGGYTLAGAPHTGEPPPPARASTVSADGEASERAPMGSRLPPTMPTLYRSPPPPTPRLPPARANSRG
jgi:hypothetical protein